MDTELRDEIIEKCKELMSKSKYDETKTQQFCDTVSDILQDFIDDPDEDREVRYFLKKHMDYIEFRLDVSGNKLDPLNDGAGASALRIQKTVNSVLFNRETSVDFAYTSGWNHIIVKSPSKIANSKLLNDSMVKAMLLGAVVGIFVRALPEGTRSVFLDGIAMPLMSTVIGLLMGIMGPVFFLFIILAVSSLGSMEALNKSGKVVLKRFILLSLWVALLTTAVAMLFFPVFGKGDTSIDVPAIESVMLGILPKGLISPFSEGNIPQIILLGIVFGIGLLMVGDSGKSIREALLKIKEWVMCILLIMMKVILLLPFLSTMLMVANGKAAIFLQGWKYIVAAYVCYLLSIVLLFIVVSLRCKKSIGELCRMLKQIALTAFVTALTPAAMMDCYEVSAKDMKIDSSFTDLWISLGLNLLSPSRTISLVLSVFFIADMTGMTVDVAMIFIMLITVVQLTLASSGTVAGATILLETLKLPTDMVGVFSAFEIFTRNAAAAYDVSYIMLEQLDAARETGNINENACKTNGV